MCLYTLDLKRKLPEKVVAYKVFSITRHGDYRGCWMPSRKFHKRRWNYDYSTGTIMTAFFGLYPRGLAFGLYPRGFHCFKYKKDAMYYARREGRACAKVLLKNLVARGTQDNQWVYVGKSLRILKIIK